MTYVGELQALGRGRHLRSTLPSLLAGHIFPASGMPTGDKSEQSMMKGDQPVNDGNLTVRTLRLQQFQCQQVPL